MHAGMVGNLLDPNELAFLLGRHTNNELERNSNVIHRKECHDVGTDYDFRCHRNRTRKTFIERNCQSSFQNLEVLRT